MMMMVVVVVAVVVAVVVVVVVVVVMVVMVMMMMMMTTTNDDGDHVNLILHHLYNVSSQNQPYGRWLLQFNRCLLGASSWHSKLWLCTFLHE
jgi:hypothetical protein